MEGDASAAALSSPPRSSSSALCYTYADYGLPLLEGFPQL